MIVMSVANNYMYEIQMKINKKKKLSDVFLLNEKVYIFIMNNFFI
jgi:hypothetical protein